MCLELTSRRDSWSSFRFSVLALMWVHSVPQHGASEPLISIITQISKPGRHIKTKLVEGLILLCFRQPADGLVSKVSKL
ncbi:MAG: hypothetical protein ACKESB_01395 [Candidatus Hodgkinia cicadicola]